MTTRRRVSRVVFAMVVIAATALVSVPGAVSAAPGEGSIPGNVVDESMQPIESICVNAYDSNGNFAASGVTDMVGDYSLENLPVGAYTLELQDCTGTGTYPPQFFNKVNNRAEATPVDVFDGMDTPTDVTMSSGFEVSGQVTDETSSGMSGIDIEVLLPSGNWYAWALTDANGEYTVPVLDGTYKIRFRDLNSNYATEYWNGAYTSDDAESLVVSGSNRSNIDAQLEVAATITGSVNDGAGPLEGICVTAYTGDPNNLTWISNTSTDMVGGYTLSGLPPIPVRVSFDDCNAPHEFIQQWYNGASNAEDATQLALPPGGTQSGIDATLSRGVTVSGRVTNQAGVGIAGVNVNLNSESSNPGGWAQTDPNGDYETSAVVPGDYRLSFWSNDPAYASEYWNDKPTWDTADLLTINSGPPVTGMDVQLATAAEISGTVTDQTGSATPNICVAALYGSDVDDLTGSGWTQTDAGGNYTLNRLPAGPTRVFFEDCNNTGPYLDELYDDTRDIESATLYDLAPGDSETGVNAQLARAGQITGTVRNTDGHALENVCVQASTPDLFGDFGKTEADGTYSLKIAEEGDYVVQFADCQNGTYLGQWYGGNIDPASATPVPVTTGNIASGIDTSLQFAGGKGALEGTVTDVRGEGLTACVVLYMPDENAMFAMTDTDGNYSFTDIPTGTYTIAYAGCGPDDVSPVIPDAGDTGVYYKARWYGGSPIALTASSPDPMAQGAQFVTFTPGETITSDVCMGCENVVVTPTVDGETVSVNFDDLGIIINPPGMSSVSAASLSYSVSCASPSGTPTASAQNSSPVTLTGLTPGAPYTCSAVVLSNGEEVSDSATFQVTVGGAPTPPTPDNGGGTDNGGSNTTPTSTPAGTPAATGNTGAATGSTTPANLAFTGSNIVAVAILATLMLLIGIGAVTATLRISRASRES
ncbi:MAG: carboxypeptidase regulatory-like domain-containing protein [Microthrixaceae bacterium]